MKESCCAQAGALLFPGELGFGFPLVRRVDRDWNDANGTRPNAMGIGIEILYTVRFEAKGSHYLCSLVRPLSTQKLLSMVAQAETIKGVTRHVMRSREAINETLGAAGNPFRPFVRWHKSVCSVCSIRFLSSSVFPGRRISFVNPTRQVRIRRGRIHYVRIEQVVGGGARIALRGCYIEAHPIVMRACVLLTIPHGCGY